MLGVLLIAASPALGAGNDVLKNRFNDPFFPLTHDIAECPEPLGPLMTEEEALRDTHHRLERGLRCYLEKRCKYSSSYQYDAQIAEHIKAEPRLAPPGSTLWVLVQGRRTWIYGCVPAAYRAGTLRDVLRKIPDVEVATEEVRAGRSGSLPYRTR